MMQRLWMDLWSSSSGASILWPAPAGKKEPSPNCCRQQVPAGWVCQPRRPESPRRPPGADEGNALGVGYERVRQAPGRARSFSAALTGSTRDRECDVGKRAAEGGKDRAVGL